MILSLVICSDKAASKAMFIDVWPYLAFVLFLRCDGGFDERVPLRYVRTHASAKFYHHTRCVGLALTAETMNTACVVSSSDGSVGSLAGSQYSPEDGSLI